MVHLTRKEFLLICGAGLAGIIGTTITTNPKQKIKTKYITTLEVNPNEFLLMQNKNKFYIALNGVGLIQGEEDDFVEELISKNIINYDACDIHNLPNIQETNTTPFNDLTITTNDGINYTLSSENEELIKSIKKYSSDILAYNNAIFEKTSKSNNHMTF